IERVRQGKDHMKVGHRKQFLLAVPNPLLTVYRLAFWTMPVAAGVVAVLFFATAIAAQPMSTQLSRTAGFNGCQCTGYLVVLGVLPQKAGSVRSDQIGNFPVRTHRLKACTGCLKGYGLLPCRVLPRAGTSWWYRCGHAPAVLLW